MSNQSQVRHVVPIKQKIGFCLRITTQSQTAIFTQYSAKYICFFECD